MGWGVCVCRELIHVIKRLRSPKICRKQAGNLGKLMVQVPVQVQRQKKSNVLAQRQAKKEREGELANFFLPDYLF